MGKNKVNRSKEKRKIQDMTLQELVDQVGPLTGVTNYMSTQALAKRNIDESRLRGLSDRQKAELLTDRIAFIMLALDARLQEFQKLSEQETNKRAEILRYINNARNLLKDINRDIYYYEQVPNGEIPKKIVHLNSTKLLRRESSDTPLTRNSDKFKKIQDAFTDLGANLEELMRKYKLFQTFMSAYV